MTDRRVYLTLDESLARRLEARAADIDTTLATVLRRELANWIGDWGLTSSAHIVQAGETLTSIAQRHYGDGNKATVIAAFNAMRLDDILYVGQILQIPETSFSATVPYGESPYIYGLHDRGGEYLMDWSGRKGWVLVTEELGADPDNHDSRSYADLADAGYGVMVRLNHGYGASGTLPHSDRYADFGRRCGNFVGGSDGCHIWVIANEPNLAVERPGGPANGQAITPGMYCEAYQLCRDAIKSQAGHEHDQVLTAAIGPWNIQTAYPENPGGDWIVYFQHMLEGMQGQVDGIALHTYARDANPAAIVSENRMDPPYDHRRSMFRTYIDFMDAIPSSLRYLPVYITETDQNVSWDNNNRGWVREAYAEINRWNSDPIHQKIRALILYRWEKHAGDIWYIQGKSGVIDDFRAALQQGYRWLN